MPWLAWVKYRTLEPWSLEASGKQQDLLLPVQAGLQKVLFILVSYSSDRGVGRPLYMHHCYLELVISIEAMRCNSIFTSAKTYLNAISRRTFFFAIAFMTTGLLFWLAGLPDDRPLISQARSTAEIFPSSATLGVARRLYVLTLPARKDRRIRMEALRKALGLRWTYVDGLRSTNELTQRIWEWVLHVRHGQPNILSDHDPSSGHPPPGTVKFSWPGDVDQLALSSAPIDFWSNTVWSTPADVLNFMPYRPTGCAVQDYRILNFNSSLPEHLVLSRARIACWYSHISVIHSIANNKDQDLDSAYVILEDDIDMEKDTVQRLKILWNSLPKDWDMVFLGMSIPMDSYSVTLPLRSLSGHCWSDERKHQPLPIVSSKSASFGKNGNPESLYANNTFMHSRLYPSNQPKCTHAYVVSKRGARRLLLYLQYPPFAYSRAIDQAIAWLIEIGKIKSYTVVPSLVIQTKIDKSDISPGTGGGWPERLVDGVLTGKLSPNLV